MAREPRYWNNTMFLIDALHESNHTACSENSFATTFQHAKISPFVGLNTQTAEQKHRRLGRIKTAASFMTLKNYMYLIRQTVELMNRRAFQSIDKQVKRHARL
jgi:hypothetical protein